MDNEPPMVTAPPDVTVEATGPNTSVALGTGSATDNVDGPLTPTAHPMGSFTVGTHTVTWSATDAAGNTGTATQTVTVTDTTAPEANFTLLQSTLWPPNHKMVSVATLSGVSDLVDPNPDVQIQVTSNQPFNGKGDGNTGTDWQVQGSDGMWDVSVLSERSGKDVARVYTIQVTVKDDEGNVTSHTATVTVPHDKGKGKGKK